MPQGALVIYPGQYSEIEKIDLAGKAPPIEEAEGGVVAWTTTTQRRPEPCTGNR